MYYKSQCLHIGTILGQGVFHGWPYLPLQSPPPKKLKFSLRLRVPEDKQRSIEPRTCAVAILPVSFAL